ncbi:molybdopterin molybdotransferase MoeA [Streptomyces orinoci]|uniref:Molybdopterin molybdenumtransferase n=1 Tax=Streptomyces orinoci TaxID=67339 RepID=A0ABV3K3B7_STRON|nr:molybdopterin molybdotransferase MoeA [Streptomyces orinoci]
MTDREGDALDRATDEALAILAEDRFPLRPPRTTGSAPRANFVPFAEDPFAEDPSAGPGPVPAPARPREAPRAAPRQAPREVPQLDVPFAGVRYYDHAAPGGSREGRPITVPETGVDHDPGPGPGHDPGPRRDWRTARRIAAHAADALGSEPCALDRALGRTLAGPLTALTDLPSFDTAAMDGWAVAGPGPWRLPEGPEDAAGVLAGQDIPPEAGPLRDGHAVPIATGARVPAGATAVLRTEHGTVSQGELHANRRATQGQDIRPRGQECRQGDELLPAGTPVTPAVLGLAAAAGYDELPVTVRPRVEVLVLGDELLSAGLPQEGRIRDALGPLLGPWLTALGAEVTAPRRLADDAEALYQALSASSADLVITTGGTASGPRDHLHPTLARLEAEPLVDGVAVRPGHPMLLARLAPGRLLVGLPGNPLAAVAGLLTLAVPVLQGLAGRAVRAPERVALSGPVPAHPTDTRLVPVVRERGAVRPLRFHGPAMLRGLAAADGLAVIPPGGGPSRRAGVWLLALPWVSG